MTSLIGSLTLCLLAACGESIGGQDRKEHHSYALAFSHPSPRSNFVRIGPGDPGSALPDVRQIESAAFSAYMRRHTGCVVNRSYPVAVLGDHRLPAGYMVPVSCVSD